MQRFPFLFLSAAVALSLAACATTTGQFNAKGNVPEAEPAISVPDADSPRPTARPQQGDIDLNAIKTVTAAEVAEATARPTARPEQDLGSTIASLGLLDRDGLWLRTPLVDTETPGRVIYRKLGSSANVTLLPIKGAAGAGSQLSLAAMQILGIDLTELAEIQVFIR